MIEPSDSIVANASYRRALNLLRGLASLFVAFYHIRYFSDFSWFENFPIIRYGYIGVDFFFILSGLIICHVYLRKSAEASGHFWGSFVWLRIARLFPVHLVIMLLMLIAALGAPFVIEGQSWLSIQELVDWISLTFLVRQWMLPDGYVWNTPAWSVSAEFFAYLVIFPLVSLLYQRSRNTILGFVLVIIGLSLFTLLVLATNTVNITRGAGPLIRVSAGFLLGSGLYLLLSQLTNTLNWDRILAWVLIAGFPLVALTSSSALPSSRIDLLIIVFLAILISATYLANGTVSKFMSRPFAFWMGEISYSFYLCHIPLMMVLSHIALSLEIERGFLFGLFCIGLSIFGAHHLYRLVEVPCRDLLRGRFISTTSLA
jgi:peptidoglycan/LPS O-acetylase OafA/YrhL